MNRDKIAEPLFWIGVFLVPTAVLLGLYGHLITPPGEGEVYYWHIWMGYERYGEYFDQYDNFDYAHWHHDFMMGTNIQILAAVLLSAGSILALAMYRTDSSRPSSQGTDGEIKSWSLPPPEPRHRRKWKYPHVSRTHALEACALAAVFAVVLAAVLSTLQAYAAGPKHSAVITVTIEDNVLMIWEGEFSIYVDDVEEASGLLTSNSDGGGQTTVNITVAWHGDSTHLCSVSCWYDGRLRTSEIWLEDQQTSRVLFDVGFH